MMMEILMMEGTGDVDGNEIDQWWQRKQCGWELKSLVVLMESIRDDDDDDDYGDDDDDDDDDEMMMMI